MNTQRILGSSRATIAYLVLANMLLIGVATSFAQVQHPRAARRIHVHRVQTHRENVAGAIHERRENIAGARQERAENIATRRSNIAAARIVLPAYVPATVAASGSIVYPPAPTVPPVTVPPPAAPSVPSAESSAPEASDSDELPDVFEGSPSYAVSRIEDGGVTALLKMDKGETKVRMVGVTAITLGQRVNLPERMSGMRLPSTQTFVENLLKGESVYVVYDTSIAEEDADGKCVAYLFRAPDGLMVNLEVIRAGFAVTDTRYEFDQKALFAKYENSARQADRGIYGIVQRIKATRGAKQ